jgi:hypothetical protein
MLLKNSGLKGDETELHSRAVPTHCDCAHVPHSIARTHRATPEEHKNNSKTNDRETKK